MKIMTFNIQHCNFYPESRIDFTPFAQEILSCGADIIGLNEVRGKGILKGYTEQAKKLAELTGYHYYFGKAISVGGFSPYGNAILSKSPILSAENIKIPDPVPKTGHEMYESRSIIKAQTEKDKEYTFFVTHMGLNRDERENAVKTLLDIAADKKCVIMGDFNCLPDAEELKPLFDKFLCSDTEKYTFPSDNPDRKIDYIFYSHDMELTDKGVSENIVSDHLSLWAEFKEK